MAVPFVGLVGCTAVSDDESVGETESNYSWRSCGGGEPGDGAKASWLNGQLRGKLAGHMNAERVACARAVARTALGRLDRRAAQLAIATTIVETNIDNVTQAVDYDSLGLFQQRPSQGWGSPGQLTDPVYATNAFLDAMLRTYGDRWRYLPFGQVCQGVQISAFPDRYEWEASDAAIIVDTVGGGTSCPGGRGYAVGKIEEKYLSLGGCQSVLGVPVSDELPTPDRIGRYSVFDRGSIYWTEALGAHEVHGVIRDKWKELGWEVGLVGYPITDEYVTPDQRGRYNVFERGSVYWTEATGAHVVHSAIRDAWKDADWEAGPLGYPTTDELGTPDGVGRYNEFEHGAIYYSPANGAYPVFGAIYEKWNGLGREQSALGYPTSKVTEVAKGFRSKFEHGTITVNTTTKAVTVVVDK